MLIHYNFEMDPGINVVREGFYRIFFVKVAIFQNLHVQIAHFYLVDDVQSNQ